MSATQDSTFVDAFVETLERERRAYVVGSFGSGKSTLLRAAASALPRALLVSPPVGDGDAAEAALIKVATHLHDSGIEEVVRDPARPTAEKVDDVVRACGNRDDLVLLLDDPFAWALEERDRSPELLFRLRDGLLDSRNAIGIAARAASPSSSNEPILLDVETNAPSQYLDLDWGQLRESAVAAVAATSRRQVPLHAFAFHVLCQAASFETRDVWPTRGVLRRLYRQMLDVAPGLAQAWTVLTTIRWPEDEETVHDVSDNAAYHDALRLCFPRLSEPGDGRLPAAFRVVGATEDGGVAGPLHDSLADVWGQRPSLIGSYERFHHTARADERQVETSAEAPMVVEQWHSLGRWLSQSGDYARAARVFSRAVAQDWTDAYAHHYLAFNLDVEGSDAPTVHEHYARALDLDPTVVWWHSRFIRFLITRERIDDAREAWDRALLRLPIDEAMPGDDLFLDLHAEVGRQLIDTLELDFAEEVLAGVGEEAFVDGSRFSDLSDELRRADAAVNGNPLLPVTAEEQGERPLLVPEYREGWGSLEAWWVASIDDVRDDGQISLTVEEHAPGAAPKVMTTAATTQGLRADGVSPSAVHPGRLLEFGFYGDDQTLVLEHPARRRLTWATRTPFPDPMRYVRRSAD